MIGSICMMLGETGFCIWSLYDLDKYCKDEGGLEPYKLIAAFHAIKLVHNWMVIIDFGGKIKDNMPG